MRRSCLAQRLILAAGRSEISLQSSLSIRSEDCETQLNGVHVHVLVRVRAPTAQSVLQQLLNAECSQS